jgi:hypothetical protein
MSAELKIHRKHLPSAGGRVTPGEHLRFLLALIACGGLFSEDQACAQTRESLSGESAAQALKRALAAEPYDLNFGPVKANVGASLGVNYTDNVFYTENREHDVMIRPEITLGALWPISDLNALRLSLGISYEWYLINPTLNAHAPLINPDSELSYHLFVGDCHLRFHENFSYQESLFFNTFTGNQPFFNFNNVGTFARLDNKVGVDATWDLNQVLLQAGYYHEDFVSRSSQFDYLDSFSEWFNASVGYRLGDKALAGVEGKASLHYFDQQTILNDHWRGQTGPFLEVTLLEGVTLRTGGGYSMARYDAAGSGTSDYDNYYAYGRISQRTLLFTHSVEGGHETVPGENANNLRNTYVRYSITSPIVEHVELGANFAANMAEEYGGPSGFDERFTYYTAGFHAGWQFAKQWRTELSYQYILKDSDLADRNYQRNRVTLAVLWAF